MIGSITAQSSLVRTMDFKKPLRAVRVVRTYGPYS